MGIGDEIMVTARARHVYRETGFPVVVMDRNGRPRWHEVWNNSPIICRQAGKPAGGVVPVAIIDCGGARPYIDYPASTARKTGEPGRWVWRRDQPREPGEIYLSKGEWGRIIGLRAQLGRFVLIEPNVKQGASSNKQWGWENWQDLVDANPQKQFLQIGPAGTRRLEGVALIPTPTFREALCVVRAAAVAVLPEGALHHAAAAECYGPGGAPLWKVGDFNPYVSAVVLFGGYIPSDVTGYRFHFNLESKTHGGCGQRGPCAGCAEYWRGLSVADVSMFLNLAELEGGASPFDDVGLAGAVVAASAP